MNIDRITIYKTIYMEQTILHKTPVSLPPTHAQPNIQK